MFIIIPCKNPECSTCLNIVTVVVNSPLLRTTINVPMPAPCPRAPKRYREGASIQLHRRWAPGVPLEMSWFQPWFHGNWREISPTNMDTVGITLWDLWVVSAVEQFAMENGPISDDLPYTFGVCTKGTPKSESWSHSVSTPGFWKKHGLLIIFWGVINLGLTWM